LLRTGKKEESEGESNSGTSRPCIWGGKINPTYDQKEDGATRPKKNLEKKVVPKGVSQKLKRASPSRAKKVGSGPKKHTRGGKEIPSAKGDD